MTSEGCDWLITVLTQEHNVGRQQWADGLCFCVFFSDMMDNRAAK